MLLTRIAAIALIVFPTPLLSKPRSSNTNTETYKWQTFFNDKTRTCYLDWGDHNTYIDYINSDWLRLHTRSPHWDFGPSSKVERWRSMLGPREVKLYFDKDGHALQGPQFIYRGYGVFEDGLYGFVVDIPAKEFLPLFRRHQRLSLEAKNEIWISVGLRKAPRAASDLKKCVRSVQKDREPVGLTRK